MRGILTWHSIDRSGSPISVSPEEWRGQVDWLASRAVRVVSVEELLAGDSREPAVALTFDDGFANFATEAAPLILANGWPVTVFVVTDHVGLDNRWGGRAAPGIPVLPLASWDTLGRLQAAGVTIGAHTRSHPRLSTVSDEVLEEELRGCRDVLTARLGGRPAGVAYPYGASDRRVAEVTAREFRWACTTELSSLRPGAPPHALPRIDAWYLRRPRRLATWGSSGFRSWLWAKRQARRVRQALPQ